MQFDPAGGALFTLTAFAEVAVVPIQLLLLQGGGKQLTVMLTFSHIVPSTVEPLDQKTHSNWRALSFCVFCQYIQKHSFMIA